MTREIKAKEVKPGMEIEWKHGSYYTRCVVGLVEKENLSYPAYSIRAVGSSAGWRTFSEGEEVTVLKEAQPEEPTEFGAKVIMDGRRFIRADDHVRPWLESEVWTWYTWAHLCEMGPVTVIPDQGWTVPVGSEATPEAHDATEPRKWDRWENVPFMVAVHSTTGDVYRKAPDGVERQTLDGEWWPSILMTSQICSFAPFTEVRDA